MSRISGSFVQRQKRIAIYHVKKFVKDSQLWKQTLSILPDFLENWHFISHFVWKSTKTLELLRIFDELFDVINGEPFLTLYKTSAIVSTSWKTMLCVANWALRRNGILLPKLFSPTVRKNCSSDRERFGNSRLKAENLQNIWDH